METDDLTGRTGQQSVRGKASLSRRSFALGTAAAIVSSCVGDRGGKETGAGRGLADQAPLDESFEAARVYAAVEDGGVHVPAVDLRKVPPEFRRSRVTAPASAPAGSIVVRPAENHLYFYLSEWEAIRYGVGVGRDGFSWSGTGIIHHMSPWPQWTPPSEMVARLPALNAYAGGMTGGIANPLGARALYIWRDGRDTLYRVHGTPEWWTIGRAMSSGCIRLFNQDIIHLASLVSAGASVKVE